MEAFHPFASVFFLSGYNNAHAATSRGVLKDHDPF
jgi:hypothetical protein